MTKLILSIVSGILVGLSFGCQSFSFFVWVGIAPFFLVLSKSNFKQTIGYAFLFGFFYYLATVFWLGNVTKLGLPFLLVYLAFYPVIFSLLFRIFSKRSLSLITIPFCWVVMEFLMENIWNWSGWTNLGYTQFRNLYLVQFADIFGVKAISFLIVVTNVLFFNILSKRKLILKQFVVVCLMFVIYGSYGFYRVNTLKQIDSIDVAVVQTNVAQELKWDTSFSPEIIEKMRLLAKETPKDSLVIFPEASWPHVINDNSRGEVDNFVDDLDRDVLLGSVRQDGDHYYNCAFLYSKDSMVAEHYDKIRLVPFGEYIPLRKYLTFIDVVNMVGDVTPGNRYKIFSYKNKKFATLICFEDAFPLLTLRLAKDSDFLINITNDAWFYGEPQVSQHLAIMVLRAIENRISIVRSANTGISGWVSFRGEIFKARKEGKELFVSLTKSFTVSLNDKRSFYSRYPRLFISICFIVLFCVHVNDLWLKHKS